MGGIGVVTRESGSYIKRPVQVNTVGAEELTLDQWLQHTNAGALYTEHEPIEDPALIAEQKQTYEDLKARRIKTYQKIYNKINNYEAY